MNLRKATENKYFIPLLIIVLINVFTWKFSIGYREPQFGRIVDGSQLFTYLTGSTVKFVSNWLEEGAVKSGFRMYENPASVEFQTIEDRLLYPSYPSGCVIPVYVLAKLTGTHSPYGIIKLTMLWNLCIQFLTELCTCLIVFLFLYKTLPLLQTTLFSLLPLTVYFCSAPLWYHQNTYFSDQCVVGYFALVLFLEFLRDELCTKPQHKKKIAAIDILLFFVNFVGCFTDWVFCFIMLIIFIKRFFTKGFGNKFNLRFIANAFLYCVPLFLALGLFVIQIISVAPFSVVIEKFLTRTAFSETANVSLKAFPIIIVKYLVHDYGIIGTAILFVGIGTWIFTLLVNRQNHKRFIRYISLIGLPCILQILFLKNHSAAHTFSVLKLEILLGFFCASLPLLFIPNHVFFKISLPISIGSDKQFSIPLLPLIFFIILPICFFENRFVNRYPNENYEHYYLSETILNDCTGYNDIVFSLTDEIRENPPQRLAYSHKRVYKIESIEDISVFLAKKTINEPYTVLIFDTQNNAKLKENKQLEVYKEIIENNQTFTLYKVLGY